jgi:phosphoenolpyruvate-protein phosphotransferase (PTS system enzyme I)
MLEVNPDLLHRFVDGLANCGLDDVIVVLPMVTMPAEVRRFQSKLPTSALQVGVSVETPAAALRIKEFLDVAQWVEIGLNDLTQYTMAWDRDVPSEERLPVDRIADPVGDLIAAVAAACRSGGTACTLGLDLRPNPVIAAQVHAFGVPSVSCAPTLVARWKDVFASVAARK